MLAEDPSPETNAPLAPPAARDAPPARAVRRDDGGRLVRLLWLLALVAAPIVAVYLATEVRYRLSYADQEGRSDAAIDGLGKVKPQLVALQTASQLVAKRVAPSVVSIHRPGFRGEEGQGSGVIVDPEGYIVTNFHVIDRARGLHVITDDGRQKEATVIGADPAIDIAVLKLDKRADEPPFVAAEWGDSDQLEVGDLVWAVGSPFGLDHSVTFGIISAKERRSSTGFTSSVFQEYLQSDVAVNPGNSGGPLVDMDGRIVGINTAIVGRAYSGISFAVPSALAREKYEELRRSGWVERGYLGIEPRPVPENVRRTLGLGPGEGVLAAKVVPEGPAGRAGMVAGDVIVKWNNQAFQDPTLLSQSIASTSVGSQAEVVVKRAQRDRVVELPLNVEVGLSPFSVRVTE